MNMHELRLLVTLGLMSTPVFAAPIVQVDGRLAVGGVGRDGVFDAVVEIRDDTGTVRLTETVTGVIVVDGAFGVDLDMASVIGDLESGQVMTVEVEIADLIATARLGAAFSAGAAENAAFAASVASADRLGDVAPASLIQVATLDDIGAVQIAFGNLTGVPAGVADGADSGNIDTLDTALVVSAGTLRLAPTSISGAMLVDGTVTSNALADLTVTTTQLAALSSADVADATLTGSDFADGSFVSSNVETAFLTTSLLTITNIACTRFGSDAFSTSPKCVRRACGTNGRIVCGFSADCQDPSSGSSLCDNVDVGFVLFPPPQ